MSLLTMASVAIGRDLAPQGAPLTKDATVSKTRVAAANDSTAAAPAAADPAVAPASSVAGFGQLLVAQIPTEALIAYTTLLALFSATGAAYTTGLWFVYGASIVVCAAAVLAGYFAQRDYALTEPDGVRGSDTATTTTTDPTAPDPGAMTGPVPVIPPPGLATPMAPAPGPIPAGAEGKPLATRSTLRGLHLPYLPAFTAMLAMAVYGLTVPGSPLQTVTGTAFGLWAGCLAVGGGVMMSIFAPLLGKGNAASPAPKQK